MPKRLKTPKFFNGLFQNYDRRVSTISTLITVLGLLITVYFITSAPKSLWFTTVRDIIIFLIVLGLMLYWFYKYSRLKALVEFEEEILFTQIKHFHSIARELRNATFHGFRPTKFEDLGGGFIDKYELDIFNRICHTITQSIRDSIVEIFKNKGIDIQDDVAVAVKLIFPSQTLLKFYQEKFRDSRQQDLLRKGRWIITVYRDPVTYARRKAEREIAKTVYDVEKNTAFMNIVVGGDDFFVCDDLENLEGYHNENSLWKSYYNSTLIVPIRYSNNETESDQYTCYGLIAIDSRNPQKRKLYKDNAECLRVLEHSADLLANFFLTLSLYRTSKQDK